MIEVNHSHIKIHNYQLGDSNTLERMLSVWDNVSFKNTWCNYYYNEGERYIVIPRGLKVNYLQYLFQDKELFINTKPDKKAKATYNCIVEPRDDKQKEAIDFLLGNNETSQNTTERMLCMKTGGGKTYCTINALSKLGYRSLVVVDQEKIMLQWKKEFLSFTDLTEDDIYLINGRQTLDKIRKMKVTQVQSKVFIATHQTLNYYMTYNPILFKNAFDKIRIGTVVYDEAHCYVNSMFNLNFALNTELTVYLTATPNRSNLQEDKVYQKSLEMVPKFGLEDKFNDLYHNIYYISYNSNPDHKTIARCQSTRGFNINAFSDYTINDTWDKFYDIILELVKICTAKEEYGKTAIILHKNEHILKLKEALEADFEGIDIGIFSSLIPSLKDREKELQKKIIISTDKSLGKAVDIKDLQFCIMTTPTSSPVLAEQTLGRLRKLDNRNVLYFDVTDVGFKSCVHQRKARRKVLDKKAKSIKLLNL